MDKQKLIEENLKLVYKVAHMFKNSSYGIEFEELVAIGYEGLVRASNAYDPSKNIKFSTLAFICIKNTILYELRASRNKFNSTNTVSLYSELDGTDIQLRDIITDPTTSREFDSAENRALINHIYKQCDDREKKIIDLYLNNYSIKDIACKLGISITWVNKLISNLKKYVKESEKMKIAETEVSCPNCCCQLEDVYHNNQHYKYCKHCDKDWGTYEEEE